MTATATSRNCYHGLIQGRTEYEQCGRIMAYVRKAHPCTRRMISDSLHMETSTVSARVNDLIRREQLVRTFHAKCPLSQVTVEWVTLPAIPQELAA